MSDRRENDFDKKINFASLSASLLLSFPVL